ncbi:MAG: transcription antitermination factor NusB [Pseudomonadota bacterium]
MTANKRGSARLYAVQALYQMDLSQTSIARIVEEYETLRIGKEVDGETYLEADLAWFRGLVGGVVKEQTVLDPIIHNILVADWPLSRIETLLRAVLRCGAFELIYRTHVPVRVVISEYLEIAKAFFDEEEIRLVNAVLDRLARDQRPEEFKTDDAK